MVAPAQTTIIMCGKIYMPGESILGFRLEKLLFASAGISCYTGIRENGTKAYIKIAVTAKGRKNPLREWGLCKCCMEGGYGLGGYFPYILRQESFIDKNGEQVHFLAREYREGKTMREYIDEGRLFTWEETLALMAEAGNRLMLISHKLGIIHTELTPEHFLMGDSKEDPFRFLGLGAFMSGKDRVNGDRLSCGQAYKVPLNANGRDEKGDIFSMGVTAYEMITGKRPWLADVPPLLPDGIPVEMADLLYAMISINPRKRPSWQEVADLDLEFNVDAEYDDWVKATEDQAEKEILDETYTDDAYERPAEQKEKDIPDFKKTAGKGIKADRDNIVTFEFHRSEKGTGGFKDIAGMQEMKDKLTDEVLFPIKNRKRMKEYGAHPINGMLLAGPQGCGKTFVAQKFAEESGMDFCMVRTSDLACTYIHGSQQRIAQLFAQAEEHAPCVICLDEIDALAPNRAEVRNASVADSVNELLSQMNNCWERGIFIIGTTNCMEVMDPAVLRKGRFDEIVYVPLPDRAARKGMFSLLLSRTICGNSIDTDLLAGQTEDYTSADIEAIVNRCILEAFRCEGKVTMDGLMASIRDTAPSITKGQMRRFEDMRMRIEGKGNLPERRIGFL